MKKLSYSEHKKALIDFCPVHLNSFSRNMNELGHECDEIVFDLETLQKSWAKENSVQYGVRNWREDIMMEQIIAYKPEIILFQGCPPFGGWLTTRLKELVPSLRKILVHNGYPSNIQDTRGIDLLLCCAPHIVDHFKRLGAKTELLYYYFDENILESLKNSKFTNFLPKQNMDLSFLGFSGYGGAGDKHHSRFIFLEELLEKTNIHMWLYEGLIKDPNLDDNAIPLIQKFPTRCHQAVMGLDMYNILESSVLTVNRHTDASNGRVGNMRMFEATGLGTCLVTDDGKNMLDLFEPDHEVITYHSTEECIEKVNYLLDNKTAAIKVGKNAMRRVLKCHTLKDRCIQINEILQNII